MSEVEGFGKETTLDGSDFAQQEPVEQLLEAAARLLFHLEVEVLGAVLIVEAVTPSGERGTKMWTVGPATLTLGLAQIAHTAELGQVQKALADG